MSATLDPPVGDDPVQTQTQNPRGVSGGTIGSYRLLERLKFDVHDDFGGRFVARTSARAHEPRLPECRLGLRVASNVRIRTRLYAAATSRTWQFTRLMRS